MASAFAGPLSRFYAGKASEAHRMRQGVETWRGDLRAAVVDKIGAQLVWDEGADLAFAADLGPAGWMALRLFAFYAEHPEFELPDTVPGLLELDREWRTAHDAKFERSLYGHLLACRLWLPGDFPVTLRAPLPDGETAEIGSLTVLANQMKWLNERTFQAEQAEIATWRALPAEPGGDLIVAARRGYAALHEAIAQAVAAGVPLAMREA